MDSVSILAAKRELQPQLDSDDWKSEECAKKAAVDGAIGPCVPPTQSVTSPLSRNCPLLLTPAQCGYSKHWDQFPNPTELKKLIGKHELILSGSDNNGGFVTVPCDDFIDYFLKQDGQEGDDEPLCVFDGNVLCVEDSGNVAEQLCTLYKVPNVKGLDFDASVLSELPFDLRPLVRYLLIGPARSGTIIHQDPDGTVTWNVVTHGRKRWALMSPEVPASIAKRESPPDGCDWAISDWFEHEWPSIMADAHKLGLPAYDFEHAEGEMVYVPAGWWHAVINIESSIAVTHNVLYKSALLDAVVKAEAKGIDARAAAIEAFKLVDNENNTGITEWLRKLSIPTHSKITPNKNVSP